MAKGGKKSRTKEQVALYAEIANLMRTLNQRSQESVAIAQKLAEAQNNLPDILKRLSENAEKASKSAKNFNKGQREGSTDTNTFARSLMSLELSLRRVQRGLNGVKNVALFAQDIAKDANQFYNMANAINASSAEMRKLDYASMQFGARVGEASGMIRGLKTDMANMRMGRGAGQLEHLMKFWGLNITGRESEQDLIVKIFKRYKSIPKELRPAFQQDAYGLSDGMVKMFSKFNSESELRDFISKQKVADTDESEKAAEKTTMEAGKTAAEKQMADIANMTANGSVTDTTNQILQKIYGFMQENPWMSATKLGIDAAGNLGSLMLGGKGIAQVLKLGKLTTVAAGATTAANAATVAGATGAGAAVTGATASALPAILVIAASLAVVAGGWYAVKSISEHLQKEGTGKNENETDEQFEQRVEAERKAYVEERALARQLMIDQGRGTRSNLEEFDEDTRDHLKDFDEDVAKSRATIKRNNELIAKQQEIVDRLAKHEIVPDSELAILSQYSGNQELNKKITEQLGGTRDLGVIKQNALAGASSDSKTDDYLAQQLSKYVKSKKLSDLQDVFKTENVGRLDNKQWEMFGQYIAKALSSEERMRMRAFVEDAPVGYAIPSNIRNNSSEITQDNTGHGFWWKFLHGGAAAQDGGMEILDAIEKEKEHDNGAKILQDIVEYSRKPTADRERQRHQETIEGLKRSQQQMKDAAMSFQGGMNAPQIPKTPVIIPSKEAEASMLEAQNGSFGKVDAVNDSADKAMEPGGVLSNSVTNNSTTTVSPTVTVNNKYDINQSFSGSQDAGTAMASAKREAERMERAATDDIATQILGGFDRFKSNMTA